jgi:hypothetical protein
MCKEMSDTETCVVQYDHKWLKDKSVDADGESVNIPQIAHDVPEPIAGFDEVPCTVCGGQGEGVVKRIPKERSAKGGDR